MRRLSVDKISCVGWVARFLATQHHPALHYKNRPEIFSGRWFKVVAGFAFFQNPHSLIDVRNRCI